MVRPKIIEAIHIQRHRVRPEPGPNTQNKPRELDPKGSHGLLCAHLRQKCGKSVGGPGLSRGTSDGNTGKVSEVQDFRGVPPTEMREKCRRSRTFEGYLRQKHGKSVGGPVPRMFTRAASNLESQPIGHRNSQKPSTDFPRIPFSRCFYYLRTTIN